MLILASHSQEAEDDNGASLPTGLTTKLRAVPHCGPLIGIDIPPVLIIIYRLLPIL